MAQGALDGLDGADVRGGVVEVDGGELLLQSSGEFGEEGAFGVGVAGEEDSGAVLGGVEDGVV